jgi:uncharacterized membrane protein YqaE (UPF0057 family)
MFKPNLKQLMKKLNPSLAVVCAFLLSTVLFSCSSNKTGFFNNNASYPYVKTNDQSADDNASAAAGRKMERNETIIAPSISAPVTKEMSKPSKKAIASVNASKNANSVPSEKLTKENRKEIKNYIKENLKGKDNKNDSGIATLLLVIIAILLPPLAVLLVDGLGGPFVLSILLWLLFYVPGLIYALYRIFKK